MKWFRFYAEVVNKPKVQRLSDKLFKTWVNCLCLASENGGNLPGVEDVAFALRLSVTETHVRINALIAARLLDKEGETITPHDWNAHQYKSDVSTERVKEFRQRQRNVSPPVTETPSDNRDRTETETEGEADAKHLPPISLAQKVAAELRLRGPGIVPAIGGAIEALVREGKGHNAAVEFLIAHGKDAQDRGETVNRFWFDDSKWTQKPRPKNGQGLSEIWVEGRGEDWKPEELAKAQEDYRRKSGSTTS